MSGPRRLLPVVLLAVWVVTPALLAGATWPRWWVYIAPEQTPMTWLQSVVLVLAGAASLLLALLCRATRTDARPWWLLAGGFAVLALDERFAVHERLRDGWLAPRGVSVPFLPWVAPGDFLVLGVALAGLCVLPLVLRAVRVDVAARRALVLGVVLAVIAVGSDSIDPATWSVAAERVQQSGEEVLELGSGLALLAAVALRLLGVLGELSQVPRERSADVVGVAG